MSKAGLDRKNQRKKLVIDILTVRYCGDFTCHVRSSFYDNSIIARSYFISVIIAYNIGHYSLQSSFYYIDQILISHSQIF